MSAFTFGHQLDPVSPHSWCGISLVESAGCCIRLRRYRKFSRPARVPSQRACTGGAAPIVLTVVDTASTNIPSSQFSKVANTADGSVAFQLQQVLPSLAFLRPGTCCCHLICADGKTVYL